MSLAKIYSAAFQGLEALPVEVEVDIAKSEQLSLIIVGLPNTAVKESRDRVSAAIRNSGFSIGLVRCTVNLAPANLKKDGTLYDLPIALGFLISLGKVRPHANYGDYLILGELGLGGELRPVRGALAVAMLARQLGKQGVLLPADNAQEAAIVPGIKVIPIKHLNDAVKFFAATSRDPYILKEPSLALASDKAMLDFSDIKGQAHAKRALEIAAAGGHNVVLSGPPGSGKTMLAKALIGIMPDLSVEEALETTKIHSIAGLLPEGKHIVSQRPFRSPHHTVSYAGLIGGGVVPRPGEVTLAHNGILFLDELPEFSRTVLEVLRQPLEDKQVTISRANGNMTYPTKFICIAAMNPCPCGYLGHPDKPCKDTDVQVHRYRSKISGPLWDRLDMHIEVPPLRYREIISTESGEPSAAVRKRVVAARSIQNNRYGKIKTNSEMNAQEIKKFAHLTRDCQDVLRYALENMGLSARASDRLLRIMRTIADLEGAQDICREHVMEALTYRNVITDK